MSRGLVLALALAASPGCVLAALWRQPLPPEASIERVRTGDGWTLGLIHYRPAGDSRGLPLLLCHGVVNNGRILDIDERQSLARFTASQGRDTYVMNLRGTPLSDGPDEAAGRSESYDVDTLVRQDVAFAVRRILEATGAPALDMVGHSMGGHLIYMYLGLGGEGVNAAAVMGAQARFFADGEQERLRHAVLGWMGVNLGATAPAPLFAHAWLPFSCVAEGPLERMGLNKDNVPPEVWRHFLATAVAPTSREVFVQLRRWTDEDRFLSADGRVDYLALLRKVRQPVLVVAAKIDRMAPLATVKPGYDALGGPKKLLVVGEENGFEVDYGHGDRVMSPRAAREVWPQLLEFFDAHDGAALARWRAHRAGAP
jgi:pimeloyl-ACP methyl ester carboxylesterase